MKVKDALNELRAANPRSAWDRGVNEYAIELLDWGIDPERELGDMEVPEYPFARILCAADEREG